MNTDEISRRETELLRSRFRRWQQSVPGQVAANPHALRVHKEMLVHRDHRVLEIGCGGGSKLLLMDNAVKFQRHTAVGVEPVARLARRAGRAFASNARPISAVLADPAELPFREGVFDVAFCADTLRFLDVRGAQSLLREAARVLKPGAMLLAWDLAPPSGRLSWWQRWWLRGHPGRLSTTKQWMSLAERSGFAFTQPADFRPWLLPPIPRSSFVAATLAPGWRYEDGMLIPETPESS